MRSISTYVGEEAGARDSDEEALSEDQRATQPNIVQSDLVLQEGVDVYIVEAKSKKRIKLSLGQDNVVCAVCGQNGAPCSSPAKHQVSPLHERRVENLNTLQTGDQANPIYSR